jgi:hypothetical protein
VPSAACTCEVRPGGLHESDGPQKQTSDTCPTAASRVTQNTENWTASVLTEIQLTSTQIGGSASGYRGGSLSR